MVSLGMSSTLLLRIVPVLSVGACQQGQLRGILVEL